MDYKEYYLKQAGSGLPYFQGSSYQRGYGLGGIFRRIFHYIMPIVKQNAVPVAKSVGKELLKSAANVVHDSLGGEDVKSSAKKRLRESVENLKKKYIHEGEGLRLKPGLSINTAKKRKAKQIKKSKKKRILDIFDKK